MAIQTVKTGAAVNDGTGDDARTAFTKINQNFTDNANAASRLVGTAAGNVIEVGAFGLGGNVSVLSDASSIRDLITKLGTQSKFTYSARDIAGAPFGAYSLGLNLYSGGDQVFVAFDVTGKKSGYIAKASSGVYLSTEFYTNQNTTKDANGFIKAASPIVNIYADSVECNDEAKLQDITFEKLGVGDYLVKGSLGFAQEGWYIEMPKDANGNVLVAVVYEQLANNDISVKTYAKMFDEETGDIVANTAKPRDIPSTRWIDLRLQELPQDDTQLFNTDETVNTNAE